MRSWFGGRSSGAGPASRTAPGDLVYAVGDIHGRLDLLDRLLGALGEDIRKSLGEHPDVKPTVVFLGDYVDRGPHAFGVIDRLARLQGQDGVDLVFLKGNHDQTFLDFLGQPERGPGWAEYGGLDTLASYGVELSGMRTDAGTWKAASDRLAAVMPPSHDAFLRGLRLSHVNGDYFFAHAGARPNVPLDQQSAEDLMWIREAFLGHRGRFSHVVVHGHTPAPEPHMDQRRIGIDTGAYVSGKLTAVRLFEAERTIISQS